MKKLFPILFFIIFKTFAQEVPPQYISYRAIALEGNNPILDTDIAIKLSILESDTSTTPIYAEIHHVHTDVNTGFYSLNIGDGMTILFTPTNTPITFNQINWATGNKFLKVEMDITNGNNFSQLVGTTQLLSVPYAFVAGQSLNGIETLPNIQSLREYNAYAENKMVYVKGYYTEGDGGGGNFIYKENESYEDNDGIYFKPTQVQEGSNGRWVRQYSEFIDVRYFGMFNNSNPNSVNASQKLQKAIDFSNKGIIGGNPEFTEGETIYIPKGEYYIDSKIILKNGVRILGESGTLFTYTGDYGNMFEIDYGVVANVSIQNLFLNLSEKSGVGAFYIKAKFPQNPDEYPHGGLWLSQFKNIRIVNLKGIGIYLEGGDLNALEMLPNQGLTFDHVYIKRMDNNFENVKMVGQQGQIVFISCGFDGPKSVDCNENVSILKRPVDNMGSESIEFLSCTFQDSVYGVILEKVDNVTFDNCWFENLDIAVEIIESKGVNILNSHFANAAGQGSNPSLISTIENGSGRCISSKDSFINVENNFIAVSVPNSPNINNDYFIIALLNSLGNNNNIINVKNNSFQNIKLSRTSGIVQTANIENIIVYNNQFPQGSGVIGGLNLDGKKLVFVDPRNSANNKIYRINSTVAPGETIFIRAFQGAITFYPMNPSIETTGKNIYLNGRTSLTLNNGQAATFIKIDNITGYEPATYQLVSISN